MAHTTNSGHNVSIILRKLVAAQARALDYLEEPVGTPSGNKRELIDGLTEALKLAKKLEG